MAVTYQDIKNNKEICAYLKKSNDSLQVLGFTDHSEKHTALVAERAARILDGLGYSMHEQELVRIAGFMHDMGNCISRQYHAECGGLIADGILREMDISLEDRLTIVSAISHHDESAGGAVDIISAAIIIADKTDIHRKRVTNPDPDTYDIYDRVNYAVTENKLSIDPIQRKIVLSLTLDETICTMHEYFETCLSRMVMSQKAAKLLDAVFSLVINNSRII